MKNLNRTILGGMPSALLLSGLVLCNFSAQADDPYSKIGVWSVAYLKVGNLSGCRAAAQFPELEVKTNYRNNVDRLRESRIHGRFLSDWIMSKKHETIISPNLFYAFVNISKDDNTFRYYVVPA
jgi:hypothetical protein